MLCIYDSLQHASHARVSQWHYDYPSGPMHGGAHTYVFWSTADQNCAQQAMT